MSVCVCVCVCVCIHIYHNLNIVLCIAMILEFPVFMAGYIMIYFVNVRHHGCMGNAIYSNFVT